MLHDYLGSTRRPSSDRRQPSLDGAPGRRPSLDDAPSRPRRRPSLDGIEELPRAAPQPSAATAEKRASMRRKSIAETRHAPADVLEAVGPKGMADRAGKQAALAAARRASSRLVGGGDFANSGAAANLVAPTVYKAGDAEDELRAETGRVLDFATIRWLEKHHGHRVVKRAELDEHKVKQLREMFDHMDVDASGDIEVEEIEQAMRYVAALNPRHPFEREQILRTFAYVRRARVLSLMNRGDAAAATWTFLEIKSRRRRGDATWICLPGDKGRDADVRKRRPTPGTPTRTAPGRYRSTSSWRS